MGKVTDKLFNKFDKFASSIYDDRFEQMDPEKQEKMLRETIYETGEIKIIRQKIMQVLLEEVENPQTKKRVMNSVKQVFEERYGEFKG